MTLRVVGDAITVRAVWIVPTVKTAVFAKTVPRVMTVTSALTVRTVGMYGVYRQELSQTRRVELYIKTV